MRRCLVEMASPWLTGRFRRHGGNSEVGADYAARSSHVGSICFFRSNQLLIFAKIGLSATGGAAQRLCAARVISKTSGPNPCAPGFPKDDPQLALIRVHPERGEFWDSPSSTVIHLYNYVKAAITGWPPNELSDNQKVELGGGHASSSRS